MWNKVSEKKLPHREYVIAFNKKWIDEDLNPDGIRVGFLEDGNFISTEWDDDCDMYVTLYEEGDDIAADDGQIKPNMPTHWMKMPTHP
jgi:hypothetical protein